MYIPSNPPMLNAILCMPARVSIIIQRTSSSRPNRQSRSKSINLKLHHAMLMSLSHHMPRPSGADLAENEWEDNHTGLPENKHTLIHSNRELPNAEKISYDILHHNPYREESDGEEVVEKYEWLSDDSGKQADWTVDTVASLLEVLEASLLESLQLAVVGCK